MIKMKCILNRKENFFLFYLFMLHVITNGLNVTSLSLKAEELIKVKSHNKIENDSSKLVLPNSYSELSSGLNDKRNFQGSVLLNFPKDNRMSGGNINLNVYNNFLITNSSITQMINGDLNNHNPNITKTEIIPDEYEQKIKKLNEKILMQLLSDKSNGKKESKIDVDKMRAIDIFLLSKLNTSSIAAYDKNKLLLNSSNNSSNIGPNLETNLDKVNGKFTMSNTRSQTNNHTKGRRNANRGPNVSANNNNNDKLPDLHQESNINENIISNSSKSPLYISHKYKSFNLSPHSQLLSNSENKMDSANDNFLLIDKNMNLDNNSFKKMNIHGDIKKNNSSVKEILSLSNFNSGGVFNSESNENIEKHQLLLSSKSESKDERNSEQTKSPNKSNSRKFVSENIKNQSIKSTKSENISTNSNSDERNDVLNLNTGVNPINKESKIENSPNNSYIHNGLNSEQSKNKTIDSGRREGNDIPGVGIENKSKNNNVIERDLHSNIPIKYKDNNNYFINDKSDDNRKDKVNNSISLEIKEITNENNKDKFFNIKQNEEEKNNNNKNSSNILHDVHNKYENDRANETDIHQITSDFINYKNNKNLKNSNLNNNKNDNRINAKSGFINKNSYDNKYEVSNKVSNNNSENLSDNLKGINNPASDKSESSYDSLNGKSHEVFNNKNTKIDSINLSKNNSKNTETQKEQNEPNPMLKHIKNKSYSIERNEMSINSSDINSNTNINPFSINSAMNKSENYNNDSNNSRNGQNNNDNSNNQNIEFNIANHSNNLKKIISEKDSTHNSLNSDKSISELSNNREGNKISEMNNENVPIHFNNHNSHDAGKLNSDHSNDKSKDVERDELSKNKYNKEESNNENIFSSQTTNDTHNHDYTKSKNIKQSFNESHKEISNEVSNIEGEQISENLKATKESENFNLSEGKNSNMNDDSNSNNDKILFNNLNNSDKNNRNNLNNAKKLNIINSHVTGPEDSNDGQSINVSSKMNKKKASNSFHSNVNYLNLNKLNNTENNNTSPNHMPDYVRGETNSLSNNPQVISENLKNIYTNSEDDSILIREKQEENLESPVFFDKNTKTAGTSDNTKDKNKIQTDETESNNSDNEGESNSDNTNEENEINNNKEKNENKVTYVSAKLVNNFDNKKSNYFDINKEQGDPSEINSSNNLNIKDLSTTSLLCLYTNSEEFRHFLLPYEKCKELNYLYASVQSRINVKETNQNIINCTNRSCSFNIFIKLYSDSTELFLYQNINNRAIPIRVFTITPAVYNIPIEGKDFDKLDKSELNDFITIYFYQQLVKLLIMIPSHSQSSIVVTADGDYFTNLPEDNKKRFIRSILFLQDVDDRIILDWNNVRIINQKEKKIQDFVVMKSLLDREKNTMTNGETSPSNINKEFVSLSFGKDGLSLFGIDNNGKADPHLTGKKLNMDTILNPSQSDNTNAIQIQSGDEKHSLYHKSLNVVDIADIEDGLVIALDTGDYASGNNLNDVTGYNEPYLVTPGKYQNEGIISDTFSQDYYNKPFFKSVNDTLFEELFQSKNKDHIIKNISRTSRGVNSKLKKILNDPTVLKLENYLKDNQVLNDYFTKSFIKDEKGVKKDDTSKSDQGNEQNLIKKNFRFSQNKNEQIKSTNKYIHANDTTINNEISFKFHPCYNLGYFDINSKLFGTGNYSECYRYISTMKHGSINKTELIKTLKNNLTEIIQEKEFGNFTFLLNGNNEKIPPHHMKEYSKIKNKIQNLCSQQFTRIVAKYSKLKKKNLHKLCFDLTFITYLLDQNQINKEKNLVLETIASTQNHLLQSEIYTSLFSRSNSPAFIIFIIFTSLLNLWVIFQDRIGKYLNKLYSTNIGQLRLDDQEIEGFISYHKVKCYLFYEDDSYFVTKYGKSFTRKFEENLEKNRKEIIRDIRELYMEDIQLKTLIEESRKFEFDFKISISIYLITFLLIILLLTSAIILLVYIHRQNTTEILNSSSLIVLSITIFSFFISSSIGGYKKD